MYNNHQDHKYMQNKNSILRKENVLV